MISFYKTFLKSQNYREEQERNGCQGWWMRGRRKWLWINRIVQGILAKALSRVSKVVVATQIYAGDKITSD